MALGAAAGPGNLQRLQVQDNAQSRSTSPGIDWNSCSTPSIFTAVTAAPSVEESSAGRATGHQFSAETAFKTAMPYLSVRVSIDHSGGAFRFENLPKHLLFSFSRLAQS